MTLDRTLGKFERIDVVPGKVDNEFADGRLRAEPYNIS